MRALSTSLSFIFCIAIVHSTFLPAGAADTGEDLTQSWWMPKHLKKTDASPSSPSKSNESVTAPASQDANADSDISAADITKSYQKNDAAQEGTFVVPNWFGSQPKPYTRPTEIYRSNLGLNPYGASFGRPIGLAGGLASGLALSALGGVPGLGWGGGLGGWRGGFGGWRGGLGGWSGGLGGWGGGLGSWGGGLGGWGGGLGGWGGGLGGWGGGWPVSSTFSPGLGSFRSTGQFATNVIQTEPSKASGNYYEPSTVDTTASGSYYASGAPALVPSMRVNKSPDNYWNDSSNPIPKELR